MPKKRHKPEEIVEKLRQVDVLVSQVKTDVCTCSLCPENDHLPSNRDPSICAISKHRDRGRRRPLYPQQRTSLGASGMSALCHIQISLLQKIYLPHRSAGGQ
ncbi:MAG: hypothetical protein EXQ83_06325 [Xanthobacteraceae bacterium]|nr:hypothetical protein [Xanthobacteraceae bacterium]